MRLRSKSKVRTSVLLAALSLTALSHAAAPPGDVVGISAAEPEASEPGALALPVDRALASRASRSVVISLGPSQLAVAGALLGHDAGTGPDAAVQDLLRGLQGVYVRSYSFAQDGAYPQADVDALRRQLAAPAWQLLLSTHDQTQGRDVEVYVRRGARRTEGMAIIATGPRELSIVNLVGEVDLSELAQLQGHLGVPPIALAQGGAAVGQSVALDRTGTWQRHRMRFPYLGDAISGTRYSCEGLADSLTFLLQQSGARLNAPVSAFPCGAGSPQMMMTAVLDFSTFGPNGNAAVSDDSAAGAADIGGSWRPVLFSPTDSNPFLHFADCELVREFDSQLLKLFSTRDEKSNLRFCLLGARYALSFQTFVPSDTPARAVGGHG